MKIRLSTILSLAVALGAGFVLFQTSQNVQDAERRLNQASSALAKERDALRVLETEWDYLNRPDRLEELARAHLKMHAQPPAALVGNSRDLPEPVLPLVPGRKPAQPVRPASVRADPVAEPDRAIPPQPAPVVQGDTRRRFDDLLNTLTIQEPAAGGGAR